MQVAKLIGEDYNEKASACVGGLRWILTKAAGAQVSGSLLDSELQQLGLPKEHAAALIKVYSDNQDALCNKLSELRGINCCGGDLDYQVDVKGLEVDGQLEPVVQLTVVKPSDSYVSMKWCMTSEQLDILVHELTEARQIMSSLT